jgi:glucan phosphoethanolaminetransferase (alkaline phosphatase superfamily)
MEFILFLTKIHEVWETGVTVLYICLEPAVYGAILGAALYFITRSTQERKIVRKSSYLFLLVLIIPIVNTGIHYKKRGLGDRPNSNKSIIKNSLYVTKSFLGKTLPLNLLNIQIVKDYATPSFTKRDARLDNVILIIGESLSSRYMSLYGYDQPTTPELLTLKQTDTNLIALKALASGVFTDSSVPMILNIEKRPNAIKHILSTQTNLFRLAKENGYTTHWISAQSNDGFSYIRSYMGLRYIDTYIDSSTYGFDKYSSAMDNILYDEIKKIDFQRKNFIVLNMIGSHEPYEHRIPKDFRPFPSNNPLERYKNSVAYTDKIISDILTYVKTIDSQTLVIFTSDHGQSVSENGFGRGDIRNPYHYQVPLILYSNRFKLNDEILTLSRENEYISHFDMSLVCAFYLGYDTMRYIDLNTAYINGNELSGNSGYVKYDLKNKRAELR